MNGMYIFKKINIYLYFYNTTTSNNNVNQD